MVLRSIAFLIVYVMAHAGLVWAYTTWTSYGSLIGTVLMCLDFPQTALGWAVGDSFRLEHAQILTFFPTLFWWGLWTWLNHEREPAPYKGVDHETTTEQPVFEDPSFTFRWRNGLGLFVLSQVEQEIFRRFQTAMPDDLRRILRDQQGRFTRSQRQYLNPECSRAMTSMQSVRFLVQHGSFPLRFPVLDGFDEYPLISCTLTQGRWSVFVELFVRNGVVSRMTYLSDYDLRRAPQDLLVQDVRLHPELLRHVVLSDEERRRGF